MTGDLERSEKLMAKILANLVESGVRRVSLTPTDLSCDTAHDRELFQDCMFWLEREGMIRVGHGDNESFELVSLTAYGFSVLGQKFVTDAGEISVGEAVKQVNAGEAQYVRLGSFFGGLLGGFTKSIG